jgi:UPF0755 protein
MLEPSRAPDPPGRRRVTRRSSPAFGAVLRFLNGFLTLSLVLGLIAGAAFYFVRYQFDRPGPLQHSAVIVIPKGEGVNAIAQRLEREGIINDSRMFMAASYYFRAHAKLKAGEYEIKREASMRNVLDTLIEGKAILYKVTVPEGLTSYQVVQILLAEPSLTGEITEIPPEGSLLPDTYRFSRSTDRQDLIARMRAERDRFLAAVWSTRSSGLPFETPEEAMILASIVEKETGRADERDRIAGVFLNRLRKGMRLQSDPTIIYGVTQGKGALGRPIRRSEIDGKTPYNTYQIDGLPPTPICNPGRAAIEAVLNPAETKDIYFVADGSGGHAFAASIREHQNNVKNWRQIEREMKAKQLEAAKAGAVDASPTAATLASAGPGVALDGGDEAGSEAGATTRTEDGVPLPVRKTAKTL